MKILHLQCLLMKLLLFVSNKQNQIHTLVQVHQLHQPDTKNSLMY